MRSSSSWTRPALRKLVLVLRKGTLGVQHSEKVGDTGPVLDLREFERRPVRLNDSLETIAALLLVGVTHESILGLFHRDQYRRAVDGFRLLDARFLNGYIRADPSGRKQGHADGRSE